MTSGKTKVLYRHETSVHNMRAPRIVVPVIMKLVNPTSVLDVGCGTGTWLKAFEESGVKDVIGIDGDYVNKDALQISMEKFIAKDLRKEWNLNRVFDLVISLEVAEHLPESAADLFVELLCKHAKAIVFSAAIPGQIGQNHLNEQWPTYWKEKFKKFGFHFHDTIRPEIWNIPEVDLWYKQNMFLVTSENTESKEGIVSLVHPDQLKMIHNMHAEYVESLVSGKQGMKLASKIFFNSIVYKLKSLLK